MNKKSVVMDGNTAAAYVSYAFTEVASIFPITPSSTMGNSQLEQKRAVECGYWHLYRFDPRLKAEGKNPFILESKDPTGDLTAYLKSERRYAALEDSFPERAERLYAKTVRDAADRLESYKRRADNE